MIKKSNRKGKFKVWTVILIILGVIVAGMVGVLVITEPGRREVRELVIDPIDFNNLRDGTYIGEYVGTKDNFRDTKVEVTISGGKITSIKILKGALDNDGKPVVLTGGLNIEDLFRDVLKSESLQVDVISGATLTSKTHLKALEEALKQAQEK